MFDDLVDYVRENYSRASKIVEPMVRLAGSIGADLLVVPRSDEQEMFHRDGWRKLVRNGRTLGWLRIFGKRTLLAENGI